MKKYFLAGKDFYNRSNALALRLFDDELVNLYDHNLFTRLPDETRLCILQNEPIVEVLVEAVSSNYTCDKGYFDLDQVYRDSCVFDPPHRRLNKFEREMNKAARELCGEDGRLLLNPVKQLKLTLKSSKRKTFISHFQSPQLLLKSHR